VEKKEDVIRNLKKLASAEDTFKNIGVVHDLTPQQQEAMKRVLQEARSPCDRDIRHVFSIC